MRLCPLAALWIVACAAEPDAPRDASDVQVVDLRCDAWVAPLGVDRARPELSWRLEGSAAGATASAFAVQAASDPTLLAAGRADLWESGQVTPFRFATTWGGKALTSRQRVFWRVQVRDGHGRASAWSAPSEFTMGLLAAGEWTAKWIASEPEHAPGPGPRVGIGWHALETKDLDEPKWVQVDLGKPCLVEDIRMHAVTRHMGHPVFGVPPRMVVEIADDPAFAGARLVARLDERETTLSLESPVIRIAGDGKPARYVRVTAHKLWKRPDGVGCAAFTELEVRAGGQNVALGAKVTAKDSVERTDWNAKALTDGVHAHGPVVSWLFGSFVVTKPLRRALAFVSGLGNYELRLDRIKVGNAWCTPGWTDYADTVLYDCHDLTPHLAPRAEPHLLELLLTGGMYDMASDTRGAQQTNRFGERKGIVQLELEYQDGTHERVGSDEQWFAATSREVIFEYSGVFGGEDVRAHPGPDVIVPCTIVAPPKGTLRGLSRQAPPLLAHEMRRGVALAPPRPGVRVFDLQENSTWVPFLVARGAAGTTVRLRPAELLSRDGSVDQASIRAGKLASYTLLGEGVERWNPTFWFCGSRYWQAEAVDRAGKPVPIDDVLLEFSAARVHAAATPTSSFRCSDDLLNRIHDLIFRAMRSNLLSVLSDCPHREKSGWLEQDHLMGRSLCYAFDMRALFRKTLGDIADTQQEDGMVPTMAPEYFFYEKGFRDSVEWGGAALLVPEIVREFYGDAHAIGAGFETMRRYVDYLATRAEGHILATGLGDWDGYGADKRTPVAVTDTCYFHRLAALLAEYATTLGKSAEAQRYASLRDAIAAAFRARFLDTATGRVATGSQSCQATALDLGLVPKELEAAAFARLVEDVEAQHHAVSCGEVGHAALLRVLARFSRSDLIWRIHHQTERPGYGWQLARGATTLTEAWDASPISQNHFMLGHLFEWLYADLAGIRPDPARPGFEHFTIAPTLVGDLTSVAAHYDSIRGRIESSWKRESGRFELTILVPPGTTASVRLPSGARHEAGPGRHRYVE